MSNLDTLKVRYQASDKKLKDLETQIEQTKTERSTIAKSIFDLQGAAPFDLDGKEVMATNMKGTYFLRTPFKPGGGKKAVQPST